MFGLTRIRIVEIGVALLLTLAAMLFVGLTVWAAEMAEIEVAGADYRWLAVVVLMSFTEYPPALCYPILARRWAR